MASHRVLAVCVPVWVGQSPPSSRRLWSLVHSNGPVSYLRLLARAYLYLRPHAVMAGGRPMFLADRSIGRAFGTLSRLSVVCHVLYCGKTVRPR